MKLRIFELPPIGTNAYLLIDEEEGNAALFDAPYGASDEVDRQLERFNAKLEGVWLTHGHWDHILDVHRFNAKDVPVWAHEADSFLIQHPESMMDYMIPGIQLHPGKIDRFAEEGSVLTILGHEVEVRHVPGHSQGSVAYVFGNGGFVISGDVVFAGSVGRTDLPGCDHETLMRSIRTQILTLDDSFVIYPGHGPRTTVAHERALNPFLQGFGRYGTR
ncbi:MAG: MBL fold metallo-hydrolase [Opitutales bacterium]|nr:MBL fold metallo-hydrolase [Opitutales bacterium]